MENKSLLYGMEETLAVITDETNSIIDHKIDKNRLHPLPENEYKKISEMVRIAHINYLLFDFLPHIKTIISETSKR